MPTMRKENIEVFHMENELRKGHLNTLLNLVLLMAKEEGMILLEDKHKMEDIWDEAGARK